MGKKILVVEDEEEVLQLLEKKLAAAGYTLFTSNNGREALALAKAQKPDLILLDIMMPYMDGPDMAAALRDDPLIGGIPIIFLSGMVTKDDAKSTHGELTVRGRQYKVISKPFNFSELLTAVREVLG